MIRIGEDINTCAVAKMNEITIAETLSTTAESRTRTLNRHQITR